MTRLAEPLVSIVLPVRNEQRYLRECLLSLVHQDCDPQLYEIVVVDGESNDRTTAIIAELLESSSRLRVLPNPGRTVSCGRNVGIRGARGRIVAFMEGHAFVNPDLVSVIAHAFADEHVLCLGRYVEQHLPGDNAVQQATGLLRKSPLGRNPHSRRFTHGGGGFVDPLSVATVYRREVFDRVGLFDEAFTTNEDVELNWRVREAGIKALQVPGLVYNLHPRATLGGFLKQMYRYGYGKALLVRKHPPRSAWHMLYPPAYLCLRPLGQSASRPGCALRPCWHTWQRPPSRL